MIIFLSLLSLALSASDTLLSLSRSSSCLKSLVAGFVKADDCSLLSDQTKVKVLSSRLSSQWRWLNASFYRWISLFLRIVQITPASCKEMHGAPLPLFLHILTISVIFTGKPFATNVLRPWFRSWANHLLRPTKPSEKTQSKPRKSYQCSTNFTIASISL